ncbi:MAG: hypothetical protein PVJ38_04095 [Candidatus Bathyarchaeota archaeon]|jgi:predicted nucleotidyltransferase
MEKPKDKDFIETHGGLIFCVVGYLHPPDRYTAYLKYSPSPEGRWSREGIRYARALKYYHVSQVEETYGYLEENHPEYLFDCPVRNITVSSVPFDSVEEYYKPRKRLSTIMDEGPRDRLEMKLIDLVTILKGLSGLDFRDLGVTGSLLTQNHSPEFSDIDLTVYGLEASQKLKETILMTRKEEGVFHPFNSAKKKLWSKDRASRFPLDVNELMDFAERRWNYGVFMDTYFSIHPVRTDEEITENYGDHIYTQHGIVTGRGVISESRDSIYLPAIYGLEDSEIEQVVQLISYEGLFCDMFDEGERVEFRGVLERITGKSDYCRVVIGGAGSAQSYIKRIR